MTFGFALTLLGTVLILSAVRDRTVLEILQGITSQNPTDPTLDLFRDAGEAAGGMAPTSMSGGGPRGKVAELLGPGDPGHSSHVHVASDDMAFLHSLAEIAKKRFGMSIREEPHYDPVDPVHVSGSYHYRHAAFDASGGDMQGFWRWMQANYG